MAPKASWYRELRKGWLSEAAPRKGENLMESQERIERFEKSVQTELLSVGTDRLSIRQLAENTLCDSPSDGKQLVEMLDPRGGGLSALVESGGLPNSGAFSKITGQIIYTSVLEDLGTQRLIHNELCTTQSTPFRNEKIAGIGGVGDKVAEVGEGQPYPEVQPRPEYIETPDTIKRGLTVSLTDEMVFFDRTNELLEQARASGVFVMINKEKRVLDAVTGVSNTFKYNGTAYNTYTDSGLYDNIAGSNALADWTDIEAARLLWGDMLNPITGEPVNISADTLLVPEALEDTANRIVTATELRSGDITSGAGNQTIGMNILNMRSRLRVLTNAYVSDRTSSTSTWFLGVPKKAFVYMENYPMQVFQEVANSGAHFERDIMYRWKIRERGAIAVKAPWFMIKATG